MNKSKSANALVAEELLKIARELIALKIKPEDYKALESFLDKAVQRIGKKKLSDYKEGLKEDSRVKDLEKRFRWDLLRASGLKIGDGKGMSGDIDLYEYMDDRQIDSALKKYVKSRKL